MQFVFEVKICTFSLFFLLFYSHANLKIMHSINPNTYKWVRVIVLVEVQLRRFMCVEENYSKHTNDTNSRYSLFERCLLVFDIRWCYRRLGRAGGFYRKNMKIFDFAEMSVNKSIINASKRNKNYWEKYFEKWFFRSFHGVAQLLFMLCHIEDFSNTFFMWFSLAAKKLKGNGTYSVICR